MTSYRSSGSRQLGRIDVSRFCNRSVLGGLFPAAYYANPETNDVYVRARNYSPVTGRWLSPDRLWFVDGPNRYLYVFNSPIGFSDPSGEFRIVANGTSCPGCGQAAVYWRFMEHTLDEWFLVQKICTTLTIQECKQGCGCEPEIPKTCNKCIYERIRIGETGGHDLWRFPWYIPAGNCGTIGFGTTISEIRTFRGDFVTTDDVWKEPAEEKFCDFKPINLGTHRDAPPSYWDKPTARYHSYLAAGWNCCSKEKKIGFMTYGTTGSSFNFLTCPTRDDPRGPIKW